ncbi:MAG TPA: hypothetical protein VMW58_07420 [Anaerolineae bacterium]|nr:hypothetical protein [Anaerolineae bacterium]
MITTRFYLCALPAAMWEEDVSWNDHSIAIHSFVEDALGIERRIGKGVNQDNERTRYNLCCARIEAATYSWPMSSAADAKQLKAALKARRLPAITLETDYLNVLALVTQKAPVKASEIRLGATFFPPEMVEAHYSAFDDLARQLGLAEYTDVRQRVAFFQLAHQFDCGVVELQDAFHFVTGDGPARLAPLQDDSDACEALLPRDEEATDNYGRNLYDILREQVQRAIQAVREGGTGAINFSNQPHNVITEVLHEFAYSDPGDTNGPVYIQVVYTDGSQGEPFPLRCLPQRAQSDLADLRRSQPLRVALMSMRHLEMDHDVDMAWFRNREVSKSRTLAETDTFCYLQTRNQLRETRSGGDLRIYLYQTGLQPAVIGFYRALVEELVRRADSPASLEVVPHYFQRRTGYRPGQPWR